jgi:hypothetical protein
VEEIDKESNLLLNYNFNLVLREQEQVALLALQPPLLTPYSSAQRPSIITAIQEEGLASIVTACHRAGSGSNRAVINSTIRQAVEGAAI